MCVCLQLHCHDSQTRLVKEATFIVFNQVNPSTKTAIYNVIQHEYVLEGYV